MNFPLPKAEAARLLLLISQRQRWKFIHKAADDALPGAVKTIQISFARAKAAISQAALRKALAAKDEKRTMGVISSAIEAFQTDFTPKLKKILGVVMETSGTAGAAKLKQQLGMRRLLRGATWDPDQPRDDDGKWGVSSKGDTEVSASSDHQEAVKAYTAGSDQINDSLRAHGTVQAKHSADVERMDKAIESSTLKEDTTLYRAVPKEVVEKLLDGATFTDPAYVSTSLSPNITSKLHKELGMDKDYFTPIRIIAPKGTHALNVNATLKEDHEYSWQKEVILPRGVKFRVERRGNRVTLRIEQ